uniref:Uncharacterized protein n=1 Tax=Coprothermobacter proteolyticus (strain ATCC 35245 / DSM 5265 / OCM 4 / BT) TaxID=309798 RepID=B5Y622_COPPD
MLLPLKLSVNKSFAGKKSEKLTVTGAVLSTSLIKNEQ